MLLLSLIMPLAETSVSGAISTPMEAICLSFVTSAKLQLARDVFQSSVSWKGQALVILYSSVFAALGVVEPSMYVSTLLCWQSSPIVPGSI